MKFILVTVGILLWPLGWGFASLVTDALLEIMAKESFVSATGLEAFQNFIAVAFAGLWIIASTIAGPLVIQKMISEGTNAGLAFLQGGFRAAKAGMQSAATAGSSLAATGAGAPVSMAGAVAAGSLAFGSSSMSGSGHSSVGGLSASAASWAKNTFRASDPANDRQAAAAIRRSRKSH